MSTFNYRLRGLKAGGDEEGKAAGGAMGPLAEVAGLRPGAAPTWCTKTR